MPRHDVQPTAALCCRERRFSMKMMRRARLCVAWTLCGGTRLVPLTTSLFSETSHGCPVTFHGCLLQGHLITSSTYLQQSPCSTSQNAPLFSQSEMGWGYPGKKNGPGCHSGTQPRMIVKPRMNMTWWGGSETRVGAFEGEWGSDQRGEGGRARECEVPPE